MPTEVERIDPIDPVFISYRQSDGTPITEELAWLLRAAGVPVWRDRDDLPPGDTIERLRQAIDEGLSGAVLVITPETADSPIVKHVEAPKLLELHGSDTAFALGITNGLARADGGIDYGAPDRLLGLESPQLGGVDQHSASRTGLLETVRKIAFHRISSCRTRVASADATLRVSIQTRNSPQVYDRTESELDIRVRPSDHEKLPSHDGLLDLKDTLGLLPDCITRANARRVVVTGGAHLSVALALGCAVPSSRVGQLDVVSQHGQTWHSGGEAEFTQPSPLQLIRESSNVNLPLGRPAVAAYIDLLAIGSNAAFDRFVDENEAQFVAWKHWSRVGTDSVDPGDGGAVASEIAASIRKLSADNGNAVVHLLMRCPFSMAVLVGRLTNTLRLVAYEWDDSDEALDTTGRPQYVPVMRLRASATAGVIEEVLGVDV